MRCTVCLSLYSLLSCSVVIVGLGAHDREKLNGNRTLSFYTQAREFNGEQYPMTMRESDEPYVPQEGNTFMNPTKWLLDEKLLLLHLPRAINS